MQNFIKKSLLFLLRSNKNGRNLHKLHRIPTDSSIIAPYYNTNQNIVFKCANEQISVSFVLTMETPD